MRTLSFHRLRSCLWAPLALFLLLRAGIVLLDSASPASARTHRHAALNAAPGPSANPSHWAATWAASPQAGTPGNLSQPGLRNQTIREIVFSSIGGSSARVRFTNTFGRQALRIGRAAIAVPAAGPEIAAPSSRALSFGGRRSVVIPPGDQVVSDPVALTMKPKSHLVVSIFLPGFTGPATQHADAQQVNYVARGDHALDSGGRAFTIRTQSWYLVDGVDALTPRRTLGAVVALGDSITDGFGSSINADARWPNYLSRRFDARAGDQLSVVDAGIGGNRVLSTATCCGVAAVNRFDRDVRQQTGVRDVVLLEGINDIGSSQSDGRLTKPHTEVSAEQIIAGYRRIIGSAHAAGLAIYGATLTPFTGARYWTAAGEGKREAVNRWIQTSGAFDGVIDFASAVADPRNPERLKPAYDSGDHLHPDDAGYRAMAAAVNLASLLGTRPAAIWRRGR